MKWLKQWFSRRRRFGELSEEIREHLDEKIEELVAGGMSREDAEHAARREFGNVTRAEEDSREIWRWGLLESLAADVRYGARSFRRSPGFTATAVLTVALGIGANAAIFGLLDAAVLGAMPFHEPARLVHVWVTDAGGDAHSPLPTQYLALRENSKAFESIAAAGWSDNLYGSDESSWQNLRGLAVTPSWLPTLKVELLLGRNFLEEEQTRGRDAVVILSYGCWRSRFHADDQILGKQIYLNRRRVTIVGILPRSLGSYSEDAELLTPLVMESYESNGVLRVEGSPRVRIVARLKPGASLAQARLETEAIAGSLHLWSATDRSGHFVVEDFAEMFRHPGPTMQNEMRGLWMMGAAAGVVLLIACANVANLLLARGLKRHREVALRSALGCSRGRLIRQLVTENALLFVCGGSLGLVAARWSQDLISKAATGIVSNAGYLEVTARVFVVGLAISFLSALLFGIIPALQATRVDVNESLKDTTSTTGSGVRSRQPRNYLMGLQVALGMVLLVSFGLLFRSLLRVESGTLGYDPHNMLTATANLPASRSANPREVSRLMRAVVQRIRALPGVDSAGMVTSLPMEGADSAQLKIEMPAHKPPVEEEVYFLSVSPEYFPSLKVAMLAGRLFEATDTLDSSPVVIVNQTFANVYFCGANPIGYHIALPDSPATQREIVGVVSDFRQRNPEEDLRPLAYFPLAQTRPAMRLSLAIRVRSEADMSGVAARLGSWLRPLDPQLYWQTGSMQQQIYDSESLKIRRPIVVLLACFGGLAIFLAIVGVFGVTSYSAAERTREIGVRVVLGAARVEIAGLLLREALGVAVAGLAIGTVGAVALSSFFPTRGIGWSGSGIYLYGVSRTDPLTYLVAAAVLTSVVLAASWIPARRATRVDPMVALRYE